MLYVGIALFSGVSDAYITILLGWGHESNPQPEQYNVLIESLYKEIFQDHIYPPH